VEELDGDARERADVLADGGEALADLGQVVEADDGEVVRARAGRGRRGREAADRELVGGREDRVGGVRRRGARAAAR
jgi:hypothetical protein